MSEDSQNMPTLTLQGAATSPVGNIATDKRDIIDHILKTASSILQQPTSYTSTHSDSAVEAMRSQLALGNRNRTEQTFPVTQLVHSPHNQHDPLVMGQLPELPDQVNIISVSEPVASSRYTEPGAALNADLTSNHKVQYHHGHSPDMLSQAALSNGQTDTNSFSPVSESLGMAKTTERQSPSTTSRLSLDFTDIARCDEGEYQPQPLKQRKLSVPVLAHSSPEKIVTTYNANYSTANSPCEFVSQSASVTNGCLSSKSLDTSPVDFPVSLPQRVHAKRRRGNSDITRNRDSCMLTSSGRNKGLGKANEPSYLCQVCGDVAAGFHCGAYVCEACKVRGVGIQVNMVKRLTDIVHCEVLSYSVLLVLLVGTTVPRLLFKSNYQ